ncbi:NYN domain-containing protein [Sinomonas soli]
MRAALFLDFDNFFSGLISADPASALSMAESPARWLHRLAGQDSDDIARRWLVLRCYMNPAGWVPDPWKQGERLFFSKFRPFFTQAGVEVVDCPALTRGSKNGADIRIVIDVMTALRANTRYDEFVIASADADFTPLLQVLRADDRRVTVIATSSTAPAYEALADRFLDEQDMFDLMSNDSTVDFEEEAAIPAPLPQVHNTGLGANSCGFEESVREIYSKATAPLNMAQLSSQLRTRGMDGGGTWFGAGSFRRAIERLGLPNVQFSQHYLWDSARHAEPIVTPPSAAAVPASAVSLPPIVKNFAEVTGMPRIPSAAWPIVFEMLEAYAREHEFNPTEASKWSRDQAAVKGADIPRSAFAFVIRACRDAETNLNAHPSPGAESIARALYTSILRRAETAGLEVGASEKRELADWLHCPSSDSEG